MSLILQSSWKCNQKKKKLGSKEAGHGNATITRDPKIQNRQFYRANTTSKWWWSPFYCKVSSVSSNAISSFNVQQKCWDRIVWERQTDANNFQGMKRSKFFFFLITFSGWLKNKRHFVLMLSHICIMYLIIDICQHQPNRGFDEIFLGIISSNCHYQQLR